MVIVVVANVASSGVFVLHKLLVQHVTANDTNKELILVGMQLELQPLSIVFMSPPRKFPAFQFLFSFNVIV